jgi:hypothetical protein
VVVVKSSPPHLLTEVHQSSPPLGFAVIYDCNAAGTDFIGSANSGPLREIGEIMTLDVVGQMKVFLGQLAVAFDPLIGQAREWQPLLGGLLVVLASIILAVGIVRAAKIRAAASRDSREAQMTHDLKKAAPPASAASENFRNLASDLESLRSLLRSALASLSSVDTNHETARLLCNRIAALQAQYATPISANKGIRETHAALVNQFKLLRALLDNDWSPSEASAILIQLNATARSLSAALEQPESLAAGRFGHQGSA